MSVYQVRLEADLRANRFLLVLDSPRFSSLGSVHETRWLLFNKPVNCQSPFTSLRCHFRSVTHVTCRLTAKDQDRLRNPTLGNRVDYLYLYLLHPPPLLPMNQGPDLQNIFRQSYDYLTIMPKLRSTYDGRLIHKTAYNEWKAFHRQDSRAKS